MKLIKRENASNMILTIMCWAIFSLLATRLYLQLAGYPEIGRGSWHVAHALFGAILMVTATISLVSFYGRRLANWMAIIFGIGFGLFIDEIGKYITRDNNYWFRPAIIIIYVVFVILYLIYRQLEKHQPQDKRRLWMNLLEEMEEVVNDDIKSADKKEILLKIKKLELKTNDQETSKLLRALVVKINAIEPKPDKKEWELGKIIAGAIRISYTKVFKRKLVFYGLLLFSAVYVADKFIDTTNILIHTQKMIYVQRYYSDYAFFTRADTYMISLKIIADIITAGFFLMGIFWFINKRTLRGIKFYQWGLLVSIFLGSVFKFYFEQFSAVISLGLTLLVYEGLKQYQGELMQKSAQHQINLKRKKGV